jgi:hypothetical protein
LAVMAVVAQTPAPPLARIKSPACNTPTGPFCNAGTQPLPGWTGHVFHLSQQYPGSIAGEPRPWMRFDPKTQPADYLKAVLAYFYQGNINADVESSFDPARNAVRAWYHAPWQDQGLNGREFVHGLTRERVSRAHDLAATQDHPWNNYAVGFYNAPGGLIIGRVWANHGKPDAAQAGMPEGTVAAKLLFTSAPVAEVPYLAGAPEWDAYVFADLNNPMPAPGDPKAITKLRLLQIDIAVKDSRVSNTTGWVFGTFVYGGGPGAPAGSGWSNVVPVGVMWGNDPGYAGTGPLHETWLNPRVHMPHVGYQGRLNGPVANAVSSCLACHSTAENPAGTMVAPAGTDVTPWFRDIASGTPFDPGRQSLDYSLQLAVGISNFLARQQVEQAATPGARRALVRRLQGSGSARPPRDGGPTD